MMMAAGATERDSSAESAERKHRNTVALGVGIIKSTVMAFWDLTSMARRSAIEDAVKFSMHSVYFWPNFLIFRADALYASLRFEFGFTKGGPRFSRAVNE